MSDFTQPAIPKFSAQPPGQRRSGALAVGGGRPFGPDPVPAADHRHPGGADSRPDGRPDDGQIPHP
ncbi:hypothetical protein ACFVXQ_33865, partial [Kitasatospora sp. NPDC058263]